MDTVELFALRSIVEAWASPAGEDLAFDRLRSAFRKAASAHWKAKAKILRMSKKDFATLANLSDASALDESVARGESVKDALERIHSTDPSAPGRDQIRQAWAAVKFAKVVLASRSLAAQIQRGERIDHFTSAVVALDFGIGDSPKKLSRLATGEDYDVRLLRPVEVPSFVLHHLGKAIDPVQATEEEKERARNAAMTQLLDRIEGPATEQKDDMVACVEVLPSDRQKAQIRKSMAIQARLIQRYPGRTLHDALYVEFREWARVIETFRSGRPDASWTDVETHLDNMARDREAIDESRLEFWQSKTDDELASVISAYERSNVYGPLAGADWLAEQSLRGAHSDHDHSSSVSRIAERLMVPVGLVADVARANGFDFAADDRARRIGDLARFWRSAPGRAEIVAAAQSIGSSDDVETQTALAKLMGADDVEVSALRGFLGRSPKSRQTCSRKTCH